VTHRVKAIGRIAFEFTDATRDSESARVVLDRMKTMEVREHGD
jgi:hypothetical protein